jgi:hypothetical protein
MGRSLWTWMETLSVRPTALEPVFNRTVFDTRTDFEIKLRQAYDLYAKKGHSALLVLLHTYDGSHIITPVPKKQNPWADIRHHETLGYQLVVALDLVDAKNFRHQWPHADGSIHFPDVLSDRPHIKIPGEDKIEKRHFAGDPLRRIPGFIRGIVSG